MSTPQSSPPETSLRVRSIAIGGLYGIFDHQIALKNDERTTIIHGPNGFGKTAILRLLYGALTGRYSSLRKIPFREFLLKFEDGSALSVCKRPPDSKEAGQEFSTLEFRYEDSRGHKHSHTAKPSSAIREMRMTYNALRHASQIRGTELIEVGPELWREVGSDEVLTLEDITERYEPEMQREFAALRKQRPEWLDQLSTQIAVHFIETQRLLTTELGVQRRGERKTPRISVVPQYARDLAESIRGTLARYGTLAQSLDRSFPGRIVQHDSSNWISDDDLGKRLDAQEQKRQQLIEAGLLEPEGETAFTMPHKIDSEKRSVLSVYVEDVQKKLSVFDDIAAKIDLFKNIINERFLYKEIAISKNDGFTFKARDGRSLALTDLSSGEQHEIVLYYDLLFRVQPHSLILIDEPEISLHVALESSP